MNDTQRLDWIERRNQRLQDVYWRMENEDETLREAIDSLIQLQAPNVKQEQVS